jgi:hypothetical protein
MAMLVTSVRTQYADRSASLINLLAKDIFNIGHELVTFLPQSYFWRK